MSEVVAKSIGFGIAEALRSVRPVHTAKHVARDIGAEERTVRSWLEGNPPQTGHLFKLFHVYGARFAGFCLRPCGDWAERLRMEAELDQVIADAEETIARLKQVRQAQKARKQ